ncbi:MAG: hypothetical protein ACI8ZB_004044 [Desulforhopalus sp.]|jgi:hypothetical protein
MTEHFGNYLELSLPSERSISGGISGYDHVLRVQEQGQLLRSFPGKGLPRRRSIQATFTYSFSVYFDIPFSLGGRQRDTKKRFY